MRGAVRVLGVIGRKGGVGKTTLAVNLAAELASRQRQVLLVDADLQGSASYWAEPGNLPVEVLALPLEDDSDVAAWARRLRGSDAEVVVVDAPPHLDATLVGLVETADLVLIPCGPSGLDLMATGDMVELVHEIRSARRDGGPGIVIVPNRVDRRTNTGRRLAGALADLDEAVAPALGLRMAYADAFIAGQWVGSYAPGSLAHQEVQALASFLWPRLG